VRQFISIAFTLSIIPATCFAADSWVEDSFEDFSDGTFGDGGANTYVSAKGRIQTSNRWDVNTDGAIDILCVNSHPLVEMLDLSIYWGNGKDFSIRNHSYVPVNGPMWVTPADLNHDKEMDLVVANYSNGTWTQMDSAVYWGGLDRNDEPGKDTTKFAFPPFKDRTFLPSQNCQKGAVGDFNKDGWEDIAFAFAGGFWEYRDKNAEGSPSRIYWSSEGAFSPDNYTDITTFGPTDVATADLDNDGWLDLVFSNAEEGKDSFVYYGGEGGFSEDRRTKLPSVAPHAVEVADVNNDNTLDIVLAQEKGETSVAYLNEGGEFDPGRKIEFQTYTAKDCVVADFNKDGFADVFFTNHQHSLTGDIRLANRLINSYLYLGSATGFSNENRQEFQTIGAWGANAADLNEDGWVDLLVCNHQEHYSYEVPSFIYWNGSEGFSITNRTPLYEHGAQGNAIADFDGDGHLDIAITSMMGRSRGDYDPSFLYLGNEEGKYSVDSRIELPGREAYEQAMADLDDDGQVDLLLVNRGEVTRWANEVFIYWNENNKFDPWRKTGLAVHSGLAVEVADLDRDGYLDLVTSNYLPVPGSKTPNPGVLIYWGSDQGFVTTERTSIPIQRTRAVSIADLNGDGHLDLVLGQERLNKKVEAVASVLFGDGTRNYSMDRSLSIEGSEDTGTPELADLDKDGHLDIAFAGEELKVFYGDGSGFPKERSVVLKIDAKTTTIDDLNGDGWLDIVCPLYKQGGNRSGYSSVLLGGPGGFDVERRLTLPTDGGAGSLVSDFNFDGYKDVFFWCHRKDGSQDRIGDFGDHFVDSFLYFNSSSGFHVENRIGLPSEGVHYDVGMDIGHIRDRSFLFDYISSPYPLEGKTPSSIAWIAETPARTSVRFQLRTGNTESELRSAEWRGPGGAGTYYAESGTPIGDIGNDRWLQYRAVLDTVNGAASPILDRVEIAFERGASKVGD
jgi:hypothetical protein